MTSIVEKSLQEHIDETPPRPLSSMQWRIWGLAASGKFFEGMIVFTTGVALPLIEKDFSLPPALKGSVAAATLFGILIGASLLGNLADRLGRKFIFVLEMIIFTVFLALTALAWNAPVLIFFLFCVGVCTARSFHAQCLPSSRSMALDVRGFSYSRDHRYSTANHHT
jgi:MFS family permease